MYATQIHRYTYAFISPTHLPLRHSKVLLLVPMPVRRGNQRVLIIWEVLVCVWLVKDLHFADAAAGFGDEPGGGAGAVVEGELFVLGGGGALGLGRGHVRYLGYEGEGWKGGGGDDDVLFLCCFREE